MKRNIIMFLFSLLTVIVSFSQTTYPAVLNDSLIVITPTQLKQTNLIFLGHQKFKVEVDEYKNQLNTYEILFNNFEKSLEEQSKQVDTLILLNKDYNYTIQEQTKKINNLDKSKRIVTGVAIGGVTLSVTLLLILLLVK